MIQFPCTNFFDAKPPILEDHEEEVFYKHPLHDIKCNQLGALFVNEEKYYVVYTVHGTYLRIREESGDLKFRDNIGMKQRVVWECYNSTVLNSGRQIYHVNGNVLDFSFGNLVPTGHRRNKEAQAILSTRRRFIKTSVETLLELEAKYEKRGMEKEQLYELLMLPHWLLTARKRWGTLRTRSKVKSGNWTGKASKVTSEEEERIIHYFDQELTYGEIMLRMGFKSKTPIRRVLARWGRSRKK